MIDEQTGVREMLNDFLTRRGLRANFLAREDGISVSVLYSFKAGRRLLTRRQLQKLESWMNDYDRKLNGTMEGGAG